jgi:HlyD family secretion protein
MTGETSAPPPPPPAPAAPAAALSSPPAARPAAVRSPRRFPRGAEIFREGDTGQFAYVVDEGTVDLVKAGPRGGKILGEVGKGGLFGEMAIIDGSPRSSTARARTDVALIEIDRAQFLRRIAANPAMALTLMGRLSAYARRSIAATAGSALDAPVPPEGGDATAARLMPLHRPPGPPEDTEALYEMPASRLLVTGTAILVGLIVVALTWMSLTFIDKTVSGRGRLTTRTPNVAVQAPDSAVIEAFLVERGQTVTAGEVVARLDGTTVRANLTVTTQKLAASERRLDRLAREQQALDGDAPARTAGLDPGNADILERRVTQHRARLEATATQMASMVQDIEAKERDAVLAREQLVAKQQIEAARESLRQKEYGSLLAYLAAKDDRVRTLRDLEAIRGAIDGLRSRLSAAGADRSAFVAEWRSGLASDIGKEEEQRLQLAEERTKLERQARDLSVRAPVDGIVLDLPKLAAGSVVRGGDPVVTLVRLNVPLAVEVDVDPKDVGDLHPGIAVSIKLDALPFQQFGDLSGTLAYVSDDTQPESLGGDRGTFYRVRVELAPDTAGRLPPGFHLTPGMLATADLKVGDRRLITYFINPLIKNLRTAFHDPR